MKKIYILNKGDSIDKACYEFDIKRDCQIKNSEAFNIRYVDIESGTDDVVIVSNYLPYYEYVVKKDDTLMGILSKGYKVYNTRDITTGDLIILSKPRSVRYVVKPLEKIDDIAKKFGVATQYIIEVNNLASHKLFVGQILWI